MRADLLTTAECDAIAGVLLPQWMQPYVPPARPFLLGPTANFGIRPGYRSRHEPRPNATPCAIPQALVQMSEAIAAALSTDIGADGVLISVGELEAADDPRMVIDRWRSARLVVVGTALRAFTMEGDDEGPPANPALVRQWTLPELQAWLDASGFEALFGGIVPETAGLETPMGVLVISAHTPAARATWRAVSPAGR